MDTMIRNLVKRHRESVSEIRRRIHRRPELSNEEEETAALVKSVLEEAGIEVRSGVGGHGVVGLLRGGADGPCVALRADMDALPMSERTGVPWASEREGVMHACGHDAHTAMLLGAALVLSDMRDQVAGKVKFIFQPAEEANPIGGAPGMIQQGALKDPDVDAMFGLHVWPSLESGVAGTRPGPLMGASDRIFLTVRGRGAHGSEPENGIDAIVIAAQVITALQTIVSRSVSPLDAAVITIGVIRGGDRYNVLPEEVVLEGTVRTTSPATRDRMPERIGAICRGVAQGMGGDCEMEYVKGYPPLVNDSELVKTAFSALKKVLGDDRVLSIEKPALGGEDFSFFSREVPSAFIWLGCRPAGVEAEGFPPLHNNRFLPDENALPIGVETMVSCALEFLGGGRVP